MNMVVNGRKINEVLIDPHYETRHSDIDDALILKLAGYLNGREFMAEERDGEWEYFVLDRIEHAEKFYRLVWCMGDQSLFIAVINGFRR
ncbi:MAG: hypothetical protein ACHQYP_08845 [Nitrospiria bacterium]